MAKPHPSHGHRFGNTAQILTRCEETRELEDGYALRYPATRTWVARIEAFQSAFRPACPHMTFELRADEAQRTLWLRIRGPDGTKEWVDSARFVFGSGLNRAPTLRNKLLRGWRRATSPLRVLPDFLIIGAKKSGSTTLYSLLVTHPSVRPAFRKEIRYFNEFWQQGPLWYRSFFPTVLSRLLAGKGSFRTGEASVDYLYWTGCAKRARALLPGVQLIAILRNPIDRAYSEYHHNRRSGVESRSFEEAIAEEKAWISGGERVPELPPAVPLLEGRHRHYLSRGLYVEQLLAWREQFDASRLLVLTVDDLDARKDEIVRETLEFLSLPHAPLSAPRKVNVAPSYPALGPQTRSDLEGFFAPYNQRLYEFLGRDLGW